MAVDEVLLDRLREALGRRRGLVEKRMFGGVAFILHGNMCIGARDDEVIARVGLDNYDDALARDHTREFAPTGRVMRGWVVVEPTGTLRDDDLRDWVAAAVAFAETLPPK